MAVGTTSREGPGDGLCVQRGGEEKGRAGDSGAQVAMTLRGRRWFGMEEDRSLEVGV